MDAAMDYYYYRDRAGKSGIVILVDGEMRGKDTGRVLLVN